MSRLVSYSPLSSQPFAAQGLSRVSMWPISLTPLIASVRPLNVPNMSSSSRDLVLAALYFMRTAFFTARFPRRSVPGVYPGSCLRFSDVVGAALPTCLEFSIAGTFASSRGVPSEHSFSPSFGSHVFRGGRVHGCCRKRFRFVGLQFSFLFLLFFLFSKGRFNRSNFSFQISESLDPKTRNSSGHCKRV